MILHWNLVQILLRDTPLTHIGRIPTRKVRTSEFAPLGEDLVLEVGANRIARDQFAIVLSVAAMIPLPGLWASVLSRTSPRLAPAGRWTQNDPELHVAWSQLTSPPAASSLDLVGISRKTPGNHRKGKTACSPSSSLSSQIC
jgi:hypothetical protein